MTHACGAPAVRAGALLGEAVATGRRPRAALPTGVVASVPIAHVVHRGTAVARAGRMVALGTARWAAGVPAGIRGCRALAGAVRGVATVLPRLGGVVAGASGASGTSPRRRSRGAADGAVQSRGRGPAGPGVRSVRAARVDRWTASAGGRLRARAAHAGARGVPNLVDGARRVVPVDLLAPGKDPRGRRGRAGTAVRVR